jgi:hypothetical protein
VPRQVQIVSQIGQCVVQRGNSIDAEPGIFGFHSLSANFNRLTYLSTIS